VTVLDLVRKKNIRNIRKILYDEFDKIYGKN
jgi:hypothetical protein